MRPRTLAIVAAILLTSGAVSLLVSDATGLLAGEPTAGSWTRWAPGGDTICADGSDYAFFAREGSADRLVVHFMGGGACWNAKTCSRPFSADGADGSYYYDRVVVTSEALAGRAHAAGLLDFSNPDNPFADWHHVFVPYCSGDLHLGDATAEYPGGVTVQHRGSANVRAVLAWTEDRFQAPEQVFVTGCSAGAYASIFWTPLLRSIYPDARMAQLADSGAGVITESFAAGGLGDWNVTASLPYFAPELDPAVLERPDALEHLYRAVGESFPQLALSQYNSAFDRVQSNFYAEMLGVAPDARLVREWGERMLASLDRLEAEVENFDSYVADYGSDSAAGTPHCITTGDDLYRVTTRGRSFLGWLRALVHGEDVGPVRPLF